MQEFNFEKAQQYEMESSKQWLNENFDIIMSDIKFMWEQKEVRPHYFDLFFKNDIELWNKFSQYVMDKNCLEISSGPCGIFPLWGHWLTGNKIIIDPLIDEYDEYIEKTFGESWFVPGTTMIATGAEKLQPGLMKQIDGFILWRNGIDHFEEPVLAMRNMSAYAIRGCTLLFWGDLVHHEAPDEGHMNTPFKTAEDFETILTSFGWDVQYRTPILRDSSKVLDYGCVATKK